MKEPGGRLWTCSHAKCLFSHLNMSRLFYWNEVSFSDWILYSTDRNAALNKLCSCFLVNRDCRFYLDPRRLNDKFISVFFHQCCEMNCMTKCLWTPNHTNLCRLPKFFHKNLGKPCLQGAKGERIGLEWGLGFGSIHLSCWICIYVISILLLLDNHYKYHTYLCCELYFHIIHSNDDDYI